MYSTPGIRQRLTFVGRMILQLKAVLLCCRMQKRSFLQLLILLVVIVGAFLLSSIITKTYPNERREKENHIAFVLKLEGYRNKPFLVKRFKNCIVSICERSTIPLTIHIIADESGKRAALPVVDEIRKTRENGAITKYLYYDIDVVVEREKMQIAEIKKATQNARGMKLRDSLFFLPIVMDHILPKHVDRVIKLDADFFFQSDIKQLFGHFDNFTSTNIFGLAKDQRSTYRVEFRKYRASHPGTKIGEPPPDGVTGYNGGLVMINLNHMRKSTLYKQLLRENAVKTFSDKYESKGWLGEQDFYVLLDIEHHELFYVVPCSWNRHLYQSTKDLKSRFHQLYYNCPEPIHAYHGNANTKMPNEQ